MWPGQDRGGECAGVEQPGLHDIGENFGPSSASSVVVTDTLPLGVTFVSASGGGANNSGVVSWTLGTLASGR